MPVSVFFLKFFFNENVVTHLLELLILAWEKNPSRTKLYPLHSFLQLYHWEEWKCWTWIAGVALREDSSWNMRSFSSIIPREGKR